MKRMWKIGLAVLLALALLAGCGGKEEEASRPETWSKTRYTAEYVPLDVTVRGGYARGVNAGDFDGEKIYCVTQLEARNYTDALFVAPPDTGEVSHLAGYADDQRVWNGNYSYHYDTRRICVAGDGVWCLAGRTENIKGVDEVRNGEMTLALLKLDKNTGNIRSEIDLKEEWGWECCSLCCDSDNNVYVPLDHKLVVFSPRGEELARLQTDTGLVVALGDGRIAFLSETGDGDQWKLQVIDPRSWSFSQPMLLNAADKDIFIYSRSQVFPGNEKYDFLMATELSLFGYHLGKNGQTGYGEHILSWLNSNIQGHEVFAVRPEGDGFLCLTANQTFGVEVAHLRPRDPDAGDPTWLTLACRSIPPEISRAVMQFNRANSDVQVEIRDYGAVSASVGLAAGIDKFTVDMISGDAPDLFYTQEMDEQMLIDRGLLEDLWPWIDNDAELGGREALVQPFFNAMSQNGKLYTISQSFQIWTTIGYNDVVGDREGWTMEEFLAAYHGLEECRSIFRAEWDWREHMMEDMIDMYSESFIDRENWTASFDSPEFAELLEYMALFPERAPVGEEGEEWMRDRQQVAETISIGNISRSKTVYKKRLESTREESTLKGYPGVPGNGAVFSAWQRVAMCANSTHKEEAWAFLRSILLPENQKALIYYDFGAPYYEWMDGIPTNRKMCDYVIEQLVREGLPGGWIGMEEIRIPWTQEDTDHFWDYVEGTVVMARSDKAVATIISDEAEKFFAGDQTAQAAAAAIQSRVNLYLGERKH